MNELAIFEQASETQTRLIGDCLDATGSTRPQFLESVQTMLDGLSEQVALIGCDGIILAVNRRWRMEVERAARTGLHVSRDYLKFLGELVESGDDRAAPVLKGFTEVSSGKRNHFKHLYIGSGPFADQAFQVVISRFCSDHDTYVLVAVHDVRELMRLKRQQRRFQSRVLQAQEDERRRIARELHDSTAQLIVGLQMGVMRLKCAEGANMVGPILTDFSHTLDEMQRELRSLSFMCHPPSLAENGLVIALNEMVDGFARRSGLRIDFLVDQVGCASESVEATIYRVAQEALSNVHRHAHGSGATVVLLGTLKCLHLLITDDGIGFDPKPHDHRAKIGVGISGMRERIRALGGRLAIRGSDRGTVLLASLPRRSKRDTADRELGEMVSVNILEHAVA